MAAAKPFVRPGYVSHFFRGMRREGVKEFKWGILVSFLVTGVGIRAMIPESEVEKSKYMRLVKGKGKEEAAHH